MTTPARLFYRAKSGAGGPVWLIYRDRARQRQCGVVRRARERLVFETKRDPAVHLCRKHQGWGIDAEVLRGLAAQGVELVRILLPDGGVEQVDLQTWLRCGRWDNLRDGPQVFLPRRALHNAQQPTLSLF